MVFSRQNANITTVNEVVNYYPTHACVSRGLYDRGWCPYIYICVCGRKKKLNSTIAIDSPFQTFAVALLVEIID